MCVRSCAGALADLTLENLFFLRCEASRAE
jgi:hypothetical protein